MSSLLFTVIYSIACPSMPFTDLVLLCHCGGPSNDVITLRYLLGYIKLNQFFVSICFVFCRLFISFGCLGFLVLVICACVCFGLQRFMYTDLLVQPIQ